MANILNRGMFSMQTSVVGMTRGSTNAAKLDKSKAQNFPSGGVGARSSAVRRAISARTKSSLCKDATPIQILSPLQLALNAAGLADFYDEQAYNTLISSFPDVLQTAQTNADAAALSASDAALYSAQAVSALAAADSYGYLEQTQSSYNAASDALAATLDAYNQAVTYRDFVASLSDKATSEANSFSII